MTPLTEDFHIADDGTPEPSSRADNKPGYIHHIASLCQPSAYRKRMNVVHKRYKVTHRQEIWDSLLDELVKENANAITAVRQ